MDTFLTIIIAIGVIIASLVFLSSSICAFSSGVDSGSRILGAFIALVSLSIVIGGVMQIAKMNRKR